MAGPRSGSLTQQWFTTGNILTSQVGVLVPGARYSQSAGLVSWVRVPLRSYMFSSPEHELLQLNYCDRQCPSCAVWRQQFDLNDYSSYTPRSTDSKFGRKYRGDL